MFVVSLNYQVSLERVDQFIPEHIRFLDEQYALGHFILSGRKEPRTGGIIIATVKEREGLAQYDITAFVPTKASDALRYLV